MSRSDKSAEPSMDEILASIRKIIAEEPPGSRKAPAPAAPRLDPPAESNGGLSLSDTLRGLRPKSSIDDVLGLADPEPRPASSAAPAGEGGAPRPFFGPAPEPIVPRAGGPAATAPQQARPSPAVSTSESKPAAAASKPAATGPLEPAPSAVLSRREPAAPAAAPAAGPTGPSPQAGSDRKPLPGVRTIDRTPTPSKPADPIGAPAEPTRIASRDSAPALAELTPARPPATLEAGLPRSGADAGPMAGSAQPKTMTPPSDATATASPAAAGTAIPAKPAVAKSAEPAPSAAPAASVIATPAPASETKVAEAPGATSAKPNTPAAMEPKAPAAAVPAATTTAKPAAPAAQPVKPAAPEHVNGVNGTPHKAATQITPTSSTDARPAPVASPAPAPFVEPANAVAKPTPVATRVAKPAAAAPPAEVTPAVVHPVGVRTLEDTVVDLLRPMLRQWLDENMPRMVEKALRIELAASVKAKSDQPKH